MPDFEAQDPEFEAKVRASFALQGLMTNLGAKIISVMPGEVIIELPYRDDITQQQSFVHGAAVAAIVDTACGYSALSLQPAGRDIVTVEYKINFVSPAVGEKMIARGRVTKAGKTLTVCSGDCHAVRNGKEKLVATLQATMMAV